MALSHAILATLLDRPHTGYELRKRFDQTVGFFWRARHQQIYQELHKMAARGWVGSTTVPQAERPDRIVYAITDLGRDIVQEWAAQPTDIPSVKEELLVKLFALGDVPTDVLITQIRERERGHRERLARYEQVMAEHYPDPAALNPRRRGRYLGLKMGILSEQTGLRWCQEALDLLALPS